METNSLYEVQFPSIYEVKGQRVMLPSRLARCTADTHLALENISDALDGTLSKLILSDLFRSYDMQLQAHFDYTSGKKKAYSPAPGGSMHEVGRAFDLSLDDLLKDKFTLGKFWEIAKDCGVVPIILTPNRKASEAWHFECRGSHQLVYDYYLTLEREQRVNMKAYEAMVTSALLDLGLFSSVRLPGMDNLNNKLIACIQASLIRLNFSPGVIDGLLGTKTLKALKAPRPNLGPLLPLTFSVDHTLSQNTTLLADIHTRLIEKLQSAYPEEWFFKGSSSPL